jgi:hypothetical protein
MLSVLSKAFDAVSAIADVFEAAVDFFRWRDDWNRTWSPVSFYLAVFSLVALTGLAWLYGAEAWAAVVRTFG